MMLKRLQLDRILLFRSHRLLWLMMGFALGFALAPTIAQAQRPFRISDPFYRNEEARRAFFEQYAVTGEVLYRSASIVQDEGFAAAANDLDFRVRLDYKLTPSLDLGAIFEAPGGAAGRSLRMNWVVLKYYHYQERSNYAFRLAVDPSSDGRAGFPQVDVAFLFSSHLSPSLSSDFAMGMRRVNIGYARLNPPEAFPENGPFVVKPQRPSILITRALGSELHLMLNYNLHFDPAGSNFFFGLLGEGGTYSMVESLLTNQQGITTNGELSLSENENAISQEKVPFRGGVVWLRGGLEYKRPNYQLSPYLGAPLRQWVLDEGEWPEARLHFGVLMMLR